MRHIFAPPLIEEASMTETIKPTMFLPLSYMLPKDVVCWSAADTAPEGLVHVVDADVMDVDRVRALDPDNGKLLDLCCGTTTDRTQALGSDVVTGGRNNVPGHVISDASTAFALLTVYRFSHLDPERTLHELQRREIAEFDKTVVGTREQLQQQARIIEAGYNHAMLDRRYLADAQLRIQFRTLELLTSALPLLWTDDSVQHLPFSEDAEKIAAHAFVAATDLVMAGFGPGGDHWHTPIDEKCMLHQGVHGYLIGASAIDFGWTCFRNTIRNLSYLLKGKP